MDDLMTTEEVARLVRKSPATMRYLRHVGRGPAGFKLGRRVLYRRDDVESWVSEARASQKVKGR